jgi:acetyltransferase-like isoleucine patch superfamily enzyme
MARVLVDDDNVCEIRGQCNGDVVVSGVGNRLLVESNTFISGNIKIVGNGNVVTIGSSCTLNGLYLDITRVNNSKVEIGSKTTIGGAALQVHEKADVFIGQDCMLSQRILISVSDMHPIFDRETGERVNPAKDIRIGDHVWIGFQSLILKGAQIQAGSIIGAGSLVSGYVPEYSIAAGVPAKILRSNVEWRRNL